MGSRSVVREFELDGEEWAVVSFRVPRPAELLVLTARELLIIDRWVEGASMRAIATANGTSIRTVANQLRSAYAKLGVSSRTELVAKLRALTEET